MKRPRLTEPSWLPIHVNSSPSLIISSRSFLNLNIRSSSSQLHQTPYNLSSNSNIIPTTTQSLNPERSLAMASLRSLITLAGLWTAFASAQVGPGQFTLTIYQPGSPLDGQVVNAANEAFWLGGGPATYCPLANQTLCPAGTQTIFAGMDALYVSTLHFGVFLVLMSTKRLKSQAVSKSMLKLVVLSVSHRPIPRPSHLELTLVISPMSLSRVTAALQSTSSIGSLPRPRMASLRVRSLSFLYSLFNCGSSSLKYLTGGILACPRENSTGTYQIYADTPAFNQTDCTRVDGLLPHYTPAGVVGAWQYI